jgi:hypothetical protein
MLRLTGSCLRQHPLRRETEPGIGLGGPPVVFEEIPAVRRDEGETGHGSAPPRADRATSITVGAGGSPALLPDRQHFHRSRVVFKIPIEP